MIGQVALDAGSDVEAIKAAKVGGVTVETAIADAIATIGENMTLRRAAQPLGPAAAWWRLVPKRVADGLGKMGVIVALESTGKAASLPRSAARSRCTSPPATRRRSMPRASTPRPSAARKT